MFFCVAKTSRFVSMTFSNTTWTLLTQWDVSIRFLSCSYKKAGLNLTLLNFLYTMPTLRDVLFFLEFKALKWGKILKWQLKSKIRQCVGAFPNHISSVRLIKTFTTNNISFQFHLIYDDIFETVQNKSEIIFPSA